MHSGLKTFLIFLIGLAAGVGISIGLLLYLFNSDAGQALVRSYVIAQNKWPDINVLLAQSVPISTAATSTGTTTTVTPDQILNTPVSIVVPKTYATQDYTTALSGAAADLQEFATSTAKLAPLLITMNTQSLSGNLAGIFDLVFKAKVLVAQQQEITAHFAQHISALSAANQQTPDAITKSMTQALVTAGTPVQSDLSEYTGLLDQLLSGSVPSPQFISSLNAAGQQLGKDITAFGAALAPLSKRFSDYSANLQASKK